jgi:hypothetical protein
MSSINPTQIPFTVPQNAQTTLVAQVPGCVYRVFNTSGNWFTVTGQAGPAIQVQPGNGVDVPTNGNNPIAVTSQAGAIAAGWYSIVAVLA